MSNEDATQNEQNLNDELALDDANNLEINHVDDNAVAADSESDNEEFEGYEVVERNQEPSPDKEQKKRNSAAAKQRIEAKEAKNRAAAAEAKLEEIKRGVIPEDLKDKLVVSPDLPDQPDINDYLSEGALEKYDFDAGKAQAAFNQANSKWLFDAQNARTVSQSNEAKVRTDYIAGQQEKVKRFHDYSSTADEMNIEGFGDAESKFLQSAGGQEAIGFVNDIFGDDLKRSVAVVNYLGRNDDEMERIMSLPPLRQAAEISRLGYDKLELRKRTKKSAPEADSGLQGGQTSASSNWQKALGDALKNKTTNEFQKLKKEFEAKLGRSIAYTEF